MGAEIQAGFGAGDGVASEPELSDCPSYPSLTTCLRRNSSQSCDVSDMSTSFKPRVFIACSVPLFEAELVSV
jgi:hypothetical protein